MEGGGIGSLEGASDALSNRPFYEKQDDGLATHRMNVDLGGIGQ